MKLLKKKKNNKQTTKQNPKHTHALVPEQIAQRGEKKKRKSEVGKQGFITVQPYSAQGRP